MTTKFLSFDAFGPYVAGGPIDQIIDAFEMAKVIYQHHHTTKGHFEMAYLGTSRADKIVKRVADRHYGERAWKFLKAQRQTLDEHFPEEAFEHLYEVLDDTHNKIYSHFDLEVQDCAQCGETCPTILVEGGRCPDCKDSP